MTIELVNQITADMRPYPMEELGRIKSNLIKEGRPVYDFGTGDPLIPTWAPIREAILKTIPIISQYPSVKGVDSLREAQWKYLGNRFNIQKHPDLSLIPAQGTKEAIFNIGLCLIGRGGKKHLIYPDPGYPVYRASALYSRGIPYPVRLTAENNMRIEPWNLPLEVQKNTAAIWINHPHNPTGATVSYDYWKELLAWCHKTDTILLSDDCYSDIYDSAFDATPTTDLAKDRRPITPLQISTDRVISFMSLSKRSGMTGYRSGMIAGDSRIINAIVQARANFGVGSPNFIQAGSTVAWADEGHVAERRKIFSHRLKLAFPYLQKLGMVEKLPDAAFYFWCKIPESFKGDDVKFILALADHGIITSPSSWLSEGMTGFFRLAMVPDDEGTIAAMEILTTFVQKNS